MLRTLCTVALILAGLTLGPVGALEIKHAEDFDRLRASMRRLDALFNDRRMTQLDIDRALVRQARTIADDAGALAQAAGALGRRLDEGAGAAERAAFIGYAEALQAEADALRAQADGGHLGGLPARLSRLRQACANCHTAFRESPP